MTICLPGYFTCMGAQCVWVLKIMLLEIMGTQNIWVFKIVGTQNCEYIVDGS